MKQTALTILLPVWPHRNWRQLAAKVSAHRDKLKGTPQLHFLSLFVVRPDVIGDCAQLGLEANFDGAKGPFLDALIAANDEFLHDVFGHCIGYVKGKKAVLRDYLLQGQRTSHIFYVARPGHTTSQIEEERRLAERVAAQIARIQQPPTGRRHDIIREVWQGLSDADRQIVLDTPKEPFWVRKYGQFLKSIFGFLKPAAFWLGMIGLAMVLATRFVGPDWGPYAPPYWVVTVAWWWAKLLAYGVFWVSLLFLALFLGEFPSALSLCMWIAVFAKKIGGYVWITIRAIPSFLALVGMAALATWQMDKFIHVATLVAPWLLLFLLAVAVLYVIALVVISRKELTDKVREMTWNKDHMMQMRAREDETIQNHFISLVEVRPGLLRRFVLWIVLRVIHWAARILYNPRGLFNTQSIHFARWSMLDGRRLLFITNYDGGFGGYLGVFATLGASGVSAIWGNTVDFPRTFMVFGDGARDEQRFKGQARASQVETLLWYRRYPELSVNMIARNAAIRQDLARFSRNDPEMHEADFDVFLRRFAVKNP